MAQATRTAFFGVQSGQSQVAALQAAEASSQSALEANQLGYQVGVRINIDVLNAQSQLFQTRRDLAQARYNVLMGGLRLKHDHRHPDGSEDIQTMYGGDTVVAGTAVRQEFPVDSYSVELFEREGLQQSTSNIWAMEVEPGKRFLYELARPSGRLFKVEFDLSQPVAVPPAPWGSQD